MCQYINLPIHQQPIPNSSKSEVLKAPTNIYARFTNEVLTTGFVSIDQITSRAQMCLKNQSFFWYLFVSDS